MIEQPPTARRPPAGPGPGGWRAVLTALGVLSRALRVATPVLYLALIACGALVEPATVAVLASAAAVAGGVGMVALRRGMAADLPQLPHPVSAAAVAAGVPAAIAGSSALGPVGGFALALALTGAAVRCGDWIASDARPGSGSGMPSGTAPWDDDGVRRLLATVPTDLLLEEWETTQRGSSPAGDRLRVIRLRELLIDELQARDPAGTARWLRVGPAEPPGRYIRPDSPSNGDHVR